MDEGYIPLLVTCLSGIAFSMSCHQRGTWEATFPAWPRCWVFSTDYFEEGKEIQCDPSAKTGFSLVMPFSRLQKNQHLWMSWWFAVMTPSLASVGRWWGYNLHSKVSQVNCNDGSTQQHLPSAYLTQISQFIVWVCSAQLWLLRTMSC